LIKERSDVNAVNEHGNTPLHYACFWGYDMICEDLLNAGAQVGIANKDGHTPIEKAKPSLAKRLQDIVERSGRESSAPVVG